MTRAGVQIRLPERTDEYRETGTAGNQGLQQQAPGTWIKVGQHDETGHGEGLLGAEHPPIHLGIDQISKRKLLRRSGLSPKPAMRLRLGRLGGRSQVGWRFRVNHVGLLRHLQAEERTVRVAIYIPFAENFDPIGGWPER